MSMTYLFLPSRMPRPVSLATLALALVMGGACTDDPAPPFEPVGTSSLAGLVFFDANNNGLFDPVAGDSALPSVGVQLRNRGTDSALARVTTDVNGRFTLIAPAGTSDLFIESSTALTTRGYIFCGGRATTYLNEQAFVNVPIKLGCVIRIIDAKVKPAGTRMTVAGIVTTQPGRFRSDNLYLQDPSSGLLVFGAIGGLGIQEGDSIEVTGDQFFFNGEAEMVNPRVAANIKKAVGVPAPKEITVAQMAAINLASAADVGRLVVVRRVRVGAFPFASGSQNATLTDPVTNATSQIRLDGTAASLISILAPATQKCYDITGPLAFFTPSVQIKPRFAQDIVEVPCT
jgi:hypothetical protein